MARNIDPGLAAIGAFIQSATISAAFHAVGSTIHTPHSRIQYVGVARLHHDLRTSCSLIHKEYPAPGLSAIGRFIDAPFSIGPKKMSHGRNPHNIRIPWMNNDPRNMPAVL